MGVESLIIALLGLIAAVSVAGLTWTLLLLWRLVNMLEDIDERVRGLIPWKLPQPPESDDCVEIVDPQGKCWLRPLPAKASDMVHPDITMALATPGYWLRYPDGRVERGIQNVDV